MPAVFGEPSVQQQWREWHDKTPTTLEEVPAAARLTTMAMPKRCEEPAARPAPLADSSATQVELLSYDNLGGGRSLSATTLTRNATALLSRTLTTADLPIGSVVALHAPPAEMGAPVGEATPFHVADVVQVELVDAPPATAGTSSALTLGATSATSDPVKNPGQRRNAAKAAAKAPADEPGQPVARLLVHYRLPYRGDTVCDDPTKNWQPACLCRQKWGKGHERYVVCKGLRDEAPTSAAFDTTKFIDWVATNAVIETKLQLTAPGKLTAGTKKRLVLDLPGNTGLEAQLGVKMQTKTSAKAARTSVEASKSADDAFA